MNWADIVILIALALSGVLGLWRGFIREVLSLAAWGLALFVAWFYTPHLMPLLEGMLANETARYVLAFALLCIGVLLLGALVVRLMAQLVRAAGMQLSDRLLGVLFGVARGVLIVALLVFAGLNFFADQPWWQNSTLLPWFVDLVEWSRLFFSDQAGQDGATV